MSAIIPRAVAKANGSYGDLAPRAEPQEDLRIVECPECDGQGVIEYGDHDHGGTARCRICNGTGREEITVEPITLEDLPEGEPCFEHDALPCAKCLSDEQWLQLMREATELEHAAALARKNNIFAHPDIERVAAEWDRSASAMRGKLAAIADQEARDIEDSLKPWSLGGR